MTPEEELIYLEGVKQYVNTRMRNIREKIIRDEKKLDGHKLSYSGLYVQTSCLIPYIQRWVDQGYSLSILADKSKVSTTFVTRVLAGKYEWTREEHADKIMSALGLPQEFSELERVRLKRKYTEVVKVPESQYYEE